MATTSYVCWAKSNVGAIATQAHTNTGYGSDGLELLEQGIAPDATLSQLLAADELMSRRQVAILGADGQVAAHTGDDCIGYASHLAGDGVCVQANMMTNEGVPEAMLAAWTATKGQRFEQRLIAALFAAEDAGGDIRGQQAAGLLIPDHFNLRVDDHKQPLAELARLVNMQVAYDKATEGEILADKGDVDGAIDAFDEATQLAPESAEIAFWYGVMLRNADRKQAAQVVFEKAFAAGEGWRELARRLPKP